MEPIWLITDHCNKSMNHSYFKLRCDIWQLGPNSQNKSRISVFKNSLRGTSPRARDHFLSTGVAPSSGTCLLLGFFTGSTAVRSHVWVIPTHTAIPSASIESTCAAKHSVHASRSSIAHTHSISISSVVVITVVRIAISHAISHPISIAHAHSSHSVSAVHSVSSV